MLFSWETEKSCPTFFNYARKRDTLLQIIEHKFDKFSWKRIFSSEITYFSSFQLILTYKKYSLVEFRNIFRIFIQIISLYNYILENTTRELSYRRECHRETWLEYWTCQRVQIKIVEFSHLNSRHNRFCTSKRASCLQKWQKSPARCLQLCASIFCPKLQQFLSFNYI